MDPLTCGPTLVAVTETPIHTHAHRSMEEALISNRGAGINSWREGCRLVESWSSFFQPNSLYCQVSFNIVAVCNHTASETSF